MTDTTVVRFLGLALICHVAFCCTDLRLENSLFSNQLFRSLPPTLTRKAGLTSGRSAYASVENEGRKTLYLYHTISGSNSSSKSDGLGRWVINDVLGNSETALSFQNSWSVHPTLSEALTDNSPNLYWRIHDGTGWVSDKSMKITCAEGAVDSTLYFDVAGLPWKISGFFVEHTASSDNGSDKKLIYAHIGAEDEQQTYLYKQQDKWMIGHEIGSGSGIAHTVAPLVHTAAELAAARTDWLFVTGQADLPVWQPYEVHIITGDENSHVYAKLREHRNFRSDKYKASYTHTLRNGIFMPSVGLGTGGISFQKTSEVLADALQHGYRMFDSAREYGNEKQLGAMLSPTTSSDPPSRGEVFLVSKVWPTFLGFIPTSREVTKSLEAFQSAYVDLYLLHWPTCQSSVSWMHCETTVDTSGNWKQSWNALERAYAEGRVSGIGVSNFDERLLGEFWGFGSVRPHVVQNFAEPGKVDFNARQWCSENQAVYMPYAHQRNLRFLSPSLRGSIEAAAVKYNVSSHVIASKFFLQTGCAIIPRSSQSAHLKDNLYSMTTFELTAAEVASMGWKERKGRTDEL